MLTRVRSNQIRHRGMERRASCDTCERAQIIMYTACNYAVQLITIANWRVLSYQFKLSVCLCRALLNITGWLVFDELSRWLKHDSIWLLFRMSVAVFPPKIVMAGCGARASFLCVVVTNDSQSRLHLGENQTRGSSIWTNTREYTVCSRGPRADVGACACVYKTCPNVSAKPWSNSDGRSHAQHERLNW